MISTSVSHKLRWLLGELHLWIALILCLPLVIIGLTGSILVFEDDLRGLAETTAHRVTVQGPEHSVDEVLAVAIASVGKDYIPTFYTPPASPSDLASVRLVPRGRNGFEGGIRVDVDPVTLATYHATGDMGWLRAISSMHSALMLRDMNGRKWVGWLGVAMLILCVTGLVNWWPRPGRWRAAFTMMKGARGYRLNRELHGVFGIWTLIVFMVVSFGGVYLAFPQTIVAMFNQVAPTRDIRSIGNIKIEPDRNKNPISAQEAITLAQQAAPGTILAYLFLPTRPDQPLRVALHHGEQERAVPTISVVINPWDGRVIQVTDPEDFTIGERFLAWQRAMHVGVGLGPVWKFAVFLTGFLPLIFTITGLSMWWSKRKN